MKYIAIILVLLFLTACSANTGINTDCPFGEVDCEYPGNCGRYVDGNNDKICDNSQIIEVKE